MQEEKEEEEGKRVAADANADGCGAEPKKEIRHESLKHETQKAVVANTNSGSSLFLLGHLCQCVNAVANELKETSENDDRFFSRTSS
uniref:Uncharacterized protein n=1 Tax=Syphacia muris TaxID=451379 RepID=A0A0N5AGT7_9BILA